MITRLKNSGWSIYAIACLLFWAWALSPHEIPQNHETSVLYILFGGGGFAFFGFFGAILNEKLLSDSDLGLLDKSLFYGMAAVIAGLLQYLYRSIPATSGAWMIITIAFLSIAAALYFIARDMVPLLMKERWRIAD